MEHPLDQFLYCPKCGSSHFEINNEKSKKCADCGFVYYFNPSAATVALILNEKNELLVCRRAKEPAKGTLDLPGGFIDMNETGEEGVAREVLEETAPGEGIGRVGALEGTMDLKQFAGKVRNDFEIPDVRMYGDPAAIIHRVAVSSGSGKSMIRGAIEKGADVIVTGDVDYHSAIDAVAQGIAVIDAGHYGTEYGFIAYMRQELETMFPELAVGTARVHHPYRVV